MERYQYICSLGEGAYGTVWKCRDQDLGQEVAMKRFKDAHTDEEVMRLALREIRLLKAANHENIIRLLEAFRSKSGRIYLVMEFVAHTLTEQLRKHPRGFPTTLLKVISWQLLQAISYLHKTKVMHRDLKPANILLTEDYQVKLCDFGFARTLSSSKENADYTTYVVTRWYRPPEVLVGDAYGAALDVWAVGCLTAEMASGRPLFPGRSNMDQLWLTLRCLGRLSERQMDLMMSDSKLSSIRAPTPEEQQTLDKRFPEFTPDLMAMLRACLHPDPTQRASADAVMQMPFFADVRAFLATGAPVTAMLTAGEAPAPVSASESTAVHTPVRRSYSRRMDTVLSTATSSSTNNSAGQVIYPPSYTLLSGYHDAHGRIINDSSMPTDCSGPLHHGGLLSLQSGTITSEEYPVNRTMRHAAPKHSASALSHSSASASASNQLPAVGSSGGESSFLLQYSSAPPEPMPPLGALRSGSESQSFLVSADAPAQHFLLPPMPQASRSVRGSNMQPPLPVDEACGAPGGAQPSLSSIMSSSQLLRSTVSAIVSHPSRNSSSMEDGFMSPVSVLPGYTHDSQHLQQALQPQHSLPSRCSSFKVQLCAAPLASTSSEKRLSASCQLPLSLMCEPSSSTSSSHQGIRAHCRNHVHSAHGGSAMLVQPHPPVEQERNLSFSRCSSPSVVHGPNQRRRSLELRTQHSPGSMAGNRVQHNPGSMTGSRVQPSGSSFTGMPAQKDPAASLHGSPHAGRPTGKHPSRLCMEHANPSVHAAQECAGPGDNAPVAPPINKKKSFGQAVRAFGARLEALISRPFSTQPAEVVADRASHNRKSSHRQLTSINVAVDGAPAVAAAAAAGATAGKLSHLHDGCSNSSSNLVLPALADALGSNASSSRLSGNGSNRGRGSLKLGS